jgi:hypothetical protein
MGFLLNRLTGRGRIFSTPALFHDGLDAGLVPPSFELRVERRSDKDRRSTLHPRAAASFFVSSGK